MFQFGVGGLWVNPVSGQTAINPTPYEMLTIQDVSLDIAQDLKELVGQNKFADDVAPAQIKLTGKFSVGRVNYPMFNQLMFANILAAGTKQMINNPGEAGTIPLVSTYIITVANAANFDTDLGVIYASNFAALTKVASGPVVGQYSVTAGIYTFAAADDGKAVYISYTWKDATTGTTVQMNNELMGYGPVFELWLSEPYQQTGTGSTLAGQGVHLWSCRLSKIGHSLKNMDYLKPEFDYTAFANSAGQVGEFFQVVP